jgi:hypothetical protein
VLGTVFAIVIAAAALACCALELRVGAVML